MGKTYVAMTSEEKAKFIIRQERYRKKNPELYALAARRYYAANKEKCLTRHRQWYEDNKESVTTKQREKKRARKLWAIEYLGGQCAACNQVVPPAAFEFHHLDPETKDRDPSKMLHLSLDRLKLELAKCQLLCANCHRIAHNTD
jgi:predicted HNH restriction endonuclease